ncbi:hypothetical protein GA0115240_10982 [Streptomyces sp. DvalAA-14]|nr:hypothetical protein GA0115240_10982 [Streptomyces sp. DvalAA-14]
MRRHRHHPAEPRRAAPANHPIRAKGRMKGRMKDRAKGRTTGPRTGA